MVPFSNSEIVCSGHVAKGRQGDGQGFKGPRPSPLAMAGAPKPFWRRLREVSVQCHRPQSVDCWLTENRILTFRHLVVLHGFTGLPSGNQTYTDTAMGNPHYINGVFVANMLRK